VAEADRDHRGGRAHGGANLGRHREGLEIVTRAEAEAFLADPDLIEAGVAADEVRRRLHGSEVTFLRVLEVPAEGPVPAIAPDTGEVRITGLDPVSSQALARIREVKHRAGDIPVSACALHELSLEAAARLRDAGLSLLSEAALDRIQPGGRDAVQGVLASGLGVARWVVQSYDPLPPIELFDRVRALGPLRSFAPLPRAIDPSAPSTGYDDVKIVALARVYLENVNTISVDWGLYGPKLAQVALTFGADDLDNVVAGGGPENLLGPRRAPLEEVKRNIRAASFTPVQRNARFETVAR
jgi:aminodeoxyfutalosine synthase